jgi:AcrR family transcriptional regulator
MSQPDTKQRILMIAAELFARQGYTGTTIADIARELGTTTAALYYHFPSKAAILSGLLARPLTAYMRLLDSLDSGHATPEDLLGAIIDICADSSELASIIDRDPAALAMIDEQLPRSSAELTAQTVAALAGPAPDRAALIRANAALAVAKAATLAAMQLSGGKLEAADRAEVLAIAMRALKDLSRMYRAGCQGRPHRPISWEAVDQGRLCRLEESGRLGPQLGRCRLISACQQTAATRGGLDDGGAQADGRRTGRRRDRAAWRGPVLAS